MPTLKFQIEETKKNKYKHEKDTDYITIKVNYSYVHHSNYVVYFITETDNDKCFTSLNEMYEISDYNGLTKLNINYRIKVIKYNNRCSFSWGGFEFSDSNINYYDGHAYLKDWQFKEEDNDKRNITILPEKLQVFNCGENYCSKLPELPNTLKTLLCNHNRISSFEFEKFPSDLTYLNCSHCRLTELPELPPKLIELNCSHNKITHIQFRLPTTLTRLTCNNNKITQLPQIHKELEFFDCSDNYIQELSFETSRLFSARRTFSCKYNPVYGFIAFNFNFSTSKYLKWKMEYTKKFVKKIEYWFLECKYNPKYKYCQSRLKKEFNELY